MKISTLLLREPFKKIFEKTMHSFLKDSTKTSYNIKWTNKTYFNNIKSTDQKWYCNPLINSLFVKGVNPNVFNSINGEYSYNTLRPLRSLFQRIYLILSQSKLTSIFMSKYVVNFSPQIEGANNKLIIGGNNKIRIIDIYNKEVYVLLKDGFNIKYLEREIYVRKVFPFLPITKINFIGNNSLWYSEEYISGVPPNRIKGKDSKIILFKAINDLRYLLNKTREKKQLNQYVKSLHNFIKDDLDKILGIEINVKNNIISITSKLLKYLIDDENNEIFVAYCHGDFHQGNILSNGDDYWILDWEHSGIKQIGYDLFLLLIGSRIDKGYSEKFINLLDGKFDDTQIELINNWPEVMCDKNVLKMEYLIVFLLEDIFFYINEYSNNLFYLNKSVLCNRSKELEKILYRLKL